MGLELGLNQLEKGKKFFLSYPVKYYNKFLSKLTNQDNPSESLLIKFYTLTSTYSNKYAFKMKNFFFYKTIKGKMININAEVSTKSKMMRMINFDITPIFKLTMNNLIMNPSLKYGRYYANRNQILNGSYDFSKVLKSMLPYHRIGLSLLHIVPIIDSSIYRIKATFNKIFNYEDNIKLTNQIKTAFIIPLKIASLMVNNDFIIKKAFIIPQRLHPSELVYLSSSASAPIYKEHHILSGFLCQSRLLEMNMMNKDNEIDNGIDCYANNVLTLRFGEFSFLPQNDIIQRIYPYMSLEAFFFPNKYSNRIKEAFQYIYSLGVSIKLPNNFFLDLSLHTGSSDNISIKKSFLNRFRIKIGY